MLLHLCAEFFCRLTKIFDVDGDPVSFEYDPENSVQVVKDANGIPTIYEYDGRGNVIGQKNSLGHETRIQYDAEDNITQTTDVNGLITTYRYDEDNNLTARSEPHLPGTEPELTYYSHNEFGDVTSITLPTGATFRQEYDEYGALLRLEDSDGTLIQGFTYDEWGNQTSASDPFGTTLYSDFDRFGNPQTLTDPDGEVTTSTYDAQGRLKTFTDSSGTSTITYDKLGREKSADYGDGLIVNYGYEGDSTDWTSIEAPTTGRIERRFTDDGRLAGWLTAGEGEIIYRYNANGQLETEIDPNGLETSYTYDQIGRIKTTTNQATGLVTEIHYDSLPEGVVDPDPDVEDYLVGRRSGQTVHVDENTSYTTGVTYYPDGQVKASIDARGNVTRFDYAPTATTVTDALNRQTVSFQSEQYLPQSVRYADGTTESTEFLFDNNLLEGEDYPTRIVDRAGRDRQFSYDSFGRLTGATDFGDTSYRFGYGDNGLETVFSPTDEALISYDYTAEGELETATYLGGGTRELTYDDTTNLLSQEILPSGETVDYHYTDAGLIEERTISDNGTVIETVTNQWNDATGQLQQVTDATGTTTYHYDPTTQELSGVDYPNGGTIRYGYDALGRPETVTVQASADADAYTTTYTYDGVGNLETITDPTTGTTTYTYDEVNRLQSRILPNGVKTAYTYKELTNFVESITHQAADGVTVLSSLTYERSVSGEPTKITRENGSYRTLAYDDALRVERESYFDGAGNLLNEVEYSYDADGNRQTVSGGVAQGSYTYENEHQLTQINTDSGAETYTYDQAGRVETVTRDGAIVRFEYDENDQLTTVRDGNNAIIVEYVYDSDGRRVEVNDAQAQRDVVTAPTAGGLDSPFLIVQDNQVAGAFSYAGDSPLVRVDEAGEAIYYLTDELGSVIGLVDAAGQSIGDFSYDSFGNALNAEGVSDELGGDFRFQGQWQEANTDLYHFRARYYDPETGRFISRDPVDIIETEPESSNPYQFVYNNPYIYSDPTGEITIGELTNARQVQSALQSVRTGISQRAKQFLIDKAQGVAGDVVQSTIKKLLPAEKVFFNTDILQAFGEKSQAGIEFENMIRGAVCNTILGSHQRYTNSLWLDPRIHTNGRPRSNGFNCGEDLPNSNFYTDISNKTGVRPDARPDFIIKNGGPKSTDHARNSRFPKSYLIGDIKLSGKALKRGIGQKQWKAITQYARYGNRHQYTPISLFITFTAPTQSQQEKVEAAAWKSGVAVAIVPILPFQASRK